MFEPLRGSPEHSDQVQLLNWTWQEGPFLNSSIHYPNRNPAPQCCQTQSLLTPELWSIGVCTSCSLFSMSSPGSSSVLKIQIKHLLFTQLSWPLPSPRQDSVFPWGFPVPVPPQSQSSNSSWMARRSGVLAPISGEVGREQAASPSDMREHSLTRLCAVCFVGIVSFSLNQGSKGEGGYYYYSHYTDRETEPQRD